MPQVLNTLADSAWNVRPAADSTGTSEGAELTPVPSWPESLTPATAQTGLPLLPTRTTVGQQIHPGRKAGKCFIAHTTCEQPPQPDAPQHHALLLLSNAQVCS